MSKNQQGTIWGSVALVMLIISIWVIDAASKHRAVVQKVAAIHTATSKNTAGIPASAAVTASTATTTAKLAATSTPPDAGQVYKHKPVTRTPALNYGEMVAKYSNTRIQFNELCQGIPGQQNMANSVTIMLDNRTDSVQRITILRKTYFVSAYNYVLVTIRQKTLPMQVSINCNGQMNASIITLE